MDPREAPMTVMVPFPRALFAIILGTGAHETSVRHAEWSELERRIFPASWTLPEAAWKPADRSLDLGARLQGLCAARFEAPPDAPWQASLGDFVLEHRRRGGSRRDLFGMLAEWRRARPADHSRVHATLVELLAADALLDPKWDPSGEREDDGVLFGALLSKNAVGTSPWKEQEGSQRFHQAAVLVHADLDALFGALHDYASAIRDRGTSYERLFPRVDTIVRGDDGEHGPFAAMRLDIRSDLPFPFTHYDCDLGILHRLDPERHVRTYVFSPGRDFYWLAGQDLHLPVRTAGGEWVGTLIVRISGFDLRGVPDDDDDRKSGTRAALGNLKRRAEARFALGGGLPRTIDGAIPPFSVIAKDP